MSLVVKELPEGPSSNPATTTRKVHILDLATELIQGVCECLDLESLKAVRQTCKELRDKSLHHFGTAYFRALRTIVSLRALKNLVAISQDLNSYVQYLSIVSQPMNFSHLYWQIESTDLDSDDSDDSNIHDDDLVISDEVRAFFYLLDQQKLMREAGSDVRLFVKAFKNFGNLKIVQLCHLFSEDGVSDPNFPTIRKINLLRRQWASEDFDQYHRPKAHLIAPVKRKLRAEAALDRTEFEMDRPSGLSLYPLNEVVVKAFEKSGRQAIQFDVTVTFSSPYEGPFDFYSYRRSIDNWNTEPFSRATTAWRKIAERHLRSLVVHGECEKTFGTDKYWTADLLRGLSVSERLEELRFSHLGHEKNVNLDLSAFNWHSLKHLSINQTIFSGSGELRGFLSKAGATLEDISLHDVFLRDQRDPWIPILEGLERMPRLCFVHLRNLYQNRIAMPQPNTGQRHLVLRREGISPGLKHAVSRLKLGPLSGAETLGLFSKHATGMVAVIFEIESDDKEAESSRH
ncbi:uncharacterized protein BDZ99DRAFT_527809 [Mytilinidion resinicola]|uniref:F-box domain-containing protein n=1 Tax=Mytilinidion resinicola TaxID=574789 RepID=A0A6A6Y003_9PEZI|nr:uncharacterized protein BDZ99DRAFT_527809 [Mytilinidion resinicola]KAF2802146.1 hypothetical protein BDZ99DRAFT_527809 [Mytilinidion resinicola]